MKTRIILSIIITVIVISSIIGYLIYLDTPKTAWDCRMKYGKVKQDIENCIARLDISQPSSEPANLQNKNCAELFDKSWTAWESFAQESQSGGAQWEPPSVAQILSGSEQFQEFRESDCRFLVNDWAYLSEFEETIWGDINWPNLESVPYTEPSSIEKLLIANHIDFNSENLVTAGHFVFEGDAGCGVVIDNYSEIHWFDVDSISNPTELEFYSENPHPCKVNTRSCFCDAQMELTAITLEKLSYFSPVEEEEYAEILLDYINNDPSMINIEPKFRLGKLNLIFTDSDAVGYCGERLGDNRNNFFSGAIVHNRIKDYGLDKELSPLCAISETAKWWE